MREGFFFSLARLKSDQQQHLTVLKKVTALCSEGPMFRRSYVQKVLCSEGSMFRRLYIQKVLCSEGPMFRNICSEGPMFRKYAGN